MARTSYLITGGAGFIGSHLVEALLGRGSRVVVLDDLSTGRMVNLDGVGSHPDFRFEQGSVLDDVLVDELVNECDVVVHLAAAVGVHRILDKPLESFLINVEGTEFVLAAAKRHKRRCLLASTSEIYGMNSSGPLSEDSDRHLGPPTVTRWSYSTAKAVDEILAFLYHREYGLPTTVVRLFNTVGPRQSPAYGMVVPRLVRQAVAGEPLTIYGDGCQTRCFCHVLDVVDCLIRLLDDPRSIGEVFNVGSGEEVSMLELAGRIRNRTRSSSPVRMVPYEEAYKAGFADMRRRVPDTTKVRTLTGWMPTRGLNDVLDETIAEALAERATMGSFLV